MEQSAKLPDSAFVLCNYNLLCMSDPYPNRFKSRGRNERTPEQLKVLEMAREKA